MTDLFGIPVLALTSCVSLAKLPKNILSFLSKKNNSQLYDSYKESMRQMKLLVERLEHSSLLIKSIS